MAKYLFGGFKRCLYPLQKFQSDSERKLAVILRPGSDQVVQAGEGPIPDLLQWGADHLGVSTDFVAETADVFIC